MQTNKYTLKTTKTHKKPKITIEIHVRYDKIKSKAQQVFKKLSRRKK